MSLEILEKLISYNTVSKESNLPLIHFVADFLDSLHFKTHLFYSSDKQKANLYAWIGPETPGGFLLSGHSDVVPITDQHWTVDPFKLTEKGDKLYGRGTSDMKGFLAQILVVVEKLKFLVTKPNLKCPLILAFTYDEEVGCLGAHELMADLQKTSFPFPSQAIIGEPSGFIPFRLHKSINMARIQIKGIPGHSSKPDKGVNAIEIASEIIQFFKNLQNELKEQQKMEEYFEVPYGTLNIGKIQGGVATNIIPSNCQLEVEFRGMPEQDPLLFCHRLEQYLKEDHFWKTSGGEVTFEVSLSRKPMLTPEKNKLQDLILPHSSSKKCFAAPYYTEGGIYNDAGIETLIFGPGNIDQAHREDEYLARSDYEKGIPLLEEILFQRLQ